MAGVHQIMGEIRALIRNHCKSGVLLGKEALYLACLEFEHRELETLFRQDEQDLTQKIEAAKKDAAEFKNDIKVLMD